MPSESVQLTLTEYKQYSFMFFINFLTYGTLDVSKMTIINYNLNEYK